MKIISDEKYKEYRELFYEVERLKTEAKRRQILIKTLRKNLDEKNNCLRIAVKGEDKIMIVKEEFTTHFLVKELIEGYGWSDRLVEKNENVTLLSPMKKKEKYGKRR